MVDDFLWGQKNATLTYSYKSIIYIQILKLNMSGFKTAGVRYYPRLGLYNFPRQPLKRPPRLKNGTFFK